MSDFIILPGDTVVCLDADLPAQPTALHTMVANNLCVGARYQVLATVWLYGEKGLHLAGLDHRPTDGWRSCRFRKIDIGRADEPTNLRAAVPHDSALTPEPMNLEDR